MISFVADIELSNELLGVSGWDDVKFVHGVPQYTLGYVLRKLPPLGHKDNYPEADSWLQLYLAGGVWFCGHNGWGDEVQADTPENAVVKLAIELFKQGVLKK